MSILRLELSIMSMLLRQNRHLRFEILITGTCTAVLYSIQGPQRMSATIYHDLRTSERNSIQFYVVEATSRCAASVMLIFRCNTLVEQGLLHYERCRTTLIFQQI